MLKMRCPTAPTASPATPLRGSPTVGRRRPGSHSPRRRPEQGRHHRQDPTVPQHGGARLDTLQAAGWISTGQTTSARGRPPSHFHFRADQGALLIADAGATGVRAAVTDLRGHVFARAPATPSTSPSDPQAWLRSVDELFADLLRKADITADFVRGIGIALPGPVDFASATVVSPPIMTGWDGYPIRVLVRR